MNSGKLYNKGFSLIELMVVIAIIAILAAVAVPVYKQYLFNGKVAPYVGLMNTLRDQALNYISKYGATPIPSQLGYHPGTGPHVGDTGYGDPADLAIAIIF